MYDVIVVGAGPAGATAAYYLARLGHSVALVDKAIFPRDKPCGGGINPKLASDFPHLRPRLGDFIEVSSHSAVLHSPNRLIAMRSDTDLDMVLRTKFDAALYETAVEQGATPIVGERVRSVIFGKQSVKVTLAGGTGIEGAAIIGADGVGSIIAREAGLHKRWPSTAITACWVAEVPMSESDIITAYTEDRETHFFANFGGLPGYAWIFPKRTTVNVGLGIVGTHAAGLPERFRGFVKFLVKTDRLPRNPDLASARGALVPTGGPIAQTYAHRTLLVGDSAGMVNPITGGGIHYAMVAAKYAAFVLSRGLELGDLTDSALAVYQRLWMQDFGNDFSSLLKVQKVVTSDFIDVLLEIGNRDERLQHMVSQAMAGHEQSEISVSRLLLRAIHVILREALT
ncbi:MAG: NAD(P)/FAD-dependent oxidoreductase [Candidatus Thorarchaeota archaeon]|nr:NAD(P)/FAD-dependent oxidoreductase [Candidatus Thorarchaeota archaeon]